MAKFENNDDILKKYILPPTNPIPGIDWIEDHVDNYFSLLNHQFLGSIFISLILFKLRMNYIILLKYSSISLSSKLMNWEGEIRVGHCNRKIKKIGYFSNIEIFCLFDTYLCQDQRLNTWKQNRNCRVLNFLILSQYRYIVLCNLI